MMETATFNMDTYKIIQLLKDKRYSEEQAEDFIEAIQEISLLGVATKKDIGILKEDVNDVKNVITVFESRLTENIKSIENNLSKEFSSHIIELQKSTTRTILATLGLMVALTIGLIKIIG